MKLPRTVPAAFVLAARAATPAASARGHAYRSRVPADHRPPRRYREHP